MPKFLTREEVYRILQRELPEGVYPDGAPSAYFSTADMDSVAALAASGYDNLETIYDNYFAQLADEKSEDWEIKVFGQVLPATQSLADRRSRVLAKVRSQLGITKADMVAVVQSVIGLDKDVVVVNWSDRDGDGTWRIGLSQLGVTTILGGASTWRAYGDTAACDDGSTFGLTPDEMLAVREQAYTYEVRIYSYTMTADEAAEVEELLTHYEPARSAHVVLDGLDAADKPDGDT